MPQPVSRHPDHAHSRPAAPWPGRARSSSGRVSASVSMRIVAALRHGIAGVDHQVHHHLFQLPLVGADRRPDPVPWRQLQVAPVRPPAGSADGSDRTARPADRCARASASACAKRPATGRPAPPRGWRSGGSGSDRHNRDRRGRGAAAAGRNGPEIAVSRLLKSCATPPASWPMACIFWLWTNCASSVFSAVASCSTASTPRPALFDDAAQRDLQEGLAARRGARAALRHRRAGVRPATSASQSATGRPSPSNRSWNSAHRPGSSRSRSRAALVGAQQCPVGGELQQRHRQMFEIGQRWRRRGRPGHRQQIDLAPLARTLDFGQDGADRAVGRRHLDLFARMQDRRGEDPVQPLWAARPAGGASPRW